MLTVNCQVTPTYNDAHIQVGYALSWAVTSKLKDLLIDETLVHDNVDRDTLGQVRQSYGNKGGLIDHFVSSCGMDKMGKVIGEDIASITGTDIIRTVVDQKQLFVKRLSSDKSKSDFCSQQQQNSFYAPQEQIMIVGF